ncbi:hypothetical protein EKL30_07000 [Candidimonas sp. SYP-B2681]|uniref:hypothetical protein n=1 Tax=Candidimonas sp. SYP-B2681 TaxID=2497686 RepID=UPI000F86F0AB|nr:hypothetical protein [Candidimonas sp. SYP-B2681]RTZ45751.1 hypothetical protein EKL30_07000 [Candidimonas sp. SYP-B2681]
MSNLSYNQYSGLSDSLERDLMRDELNKGDTFSITTLGKTIFAGLLRGARFFSSYMVDLTRALDEARAQDARFSRSQW